MNSYPHPIIAREGWTFVALALALAVVLSVLRLWIPAALAWLAVVFIVQFFRDPPRRIPSDPNAVLSPADGRIVRVEQARDPYLDRDALKISVFMNVFNVHSNRSPVDGTVIDAWYHAGSFVNAAIDKASLESERSALHLRSPAGRDVTCVLDRAADPLLCEAGRYARTRRALRLHPLRLARRCLSLAGRARESRRR
jgi:phosphatidylserine decarboxylase